MNHCPKQIDLTSPFGVHIFGIRLHILAPSFKIPKDDQLLFPAPFCELLAAWHAVDKPQLCTDLSMQERLLPALRLSPPNRGNFCSGGWFFWGRSHIGSGAGFEGLFGAVVV